MALKDCIDRWQEDLKSPNQELRNTAGLAMVLYITANLSFTKAGKGEFALDIPEGYATVQDMLAKAVDSGQITSDPVTDWVSGQQATRKLVEGAFDQPKKLIRAKTTASPK